MIRRSLLALCVVLLFGASLLGAERKPNVVFILADDLGWTDLGCQGSKFYETPHIDKLASQGMRFTHYYVSQNCAPTRAALMTGQYAPRTGIYTVGTLARGQENQRKMTVPDNVTNLPLDRKTLANVLKDAGYATGMFGKWHLGQMGEYHPSKRGFDEAIVSMGKHFDFTTNPKVDVPKEAYLADFLTGKAVDFIDRNKDKPFFLYVPHFGVHSPWEAKKEIIVKYQKKKGVGGHSDPIYAAMIESVDESVGRILATLDKHKLSDNTIVIFSADNGGVGGYASAGVKAKEVTDNAPLKGGKGQLYEGGMRVAFIARWPGTIKAGTTCDEACMHIDVLPTLAAATGAKLPEKQKLDGVSLLPLFKGEGKAKLEREALYHHLPGYLEAGQQGWRSTPCGMIRMGDYKLIEFFEDGHVELYNYREDVGEKTNLAEKMPDKAKMMREKLAAWREETRAEMPKPKTK